MSRVLAFSCTHAPYVDPRALKFLESVARRYRIDTPVMLGDLGDWHGVSRHLRLPDALGQACEYEQCLKFCRKLYKLFPDVKACYGNHDTRLAKAAQRAGIPSKLHKDIQDVYECPDGWEWAYHHRVDGTHFEHGDGVRGGYDPAGNICRQLGRSVVIGHHHSIAGVRWYNTAIDRRFACSAGCLVDTESYGMAYGKVFVLRPMLGCVVIIDGVPSFVPMGMNL